MNIYNNTFWGSNCTAVNMTVPGTRTSRRTTICPMWDNCAGTDRRNNWSTSVWPTDPFTNSAAGDYTLKSHYTPLPSPVDYGMTDAQHPTDPYTGSAPDAGAFESGVTRLDRRGQLQDVDRRQPGQPRRWRPPYTLRRAEPG